MKPASSTLNTSDWLLPEEPDLTPDQVWAVLATGNGQLQSEIVLADTVQQAMDSIACDHIVPHMCVSESQLERRIALAQNQKAHIVHSPFRLRGLHRFGFAFKDPSRVVWVDADNANSAMKALPDIGEAATPIGMINVQGDIDLRNRLRRVREARGNDAVADGRFIGRLEARIKALDISRLPGGQEEYESGVAWVDNLLRDKRAKSTHLSRGISA